MAEKKEFVLEEAFTRLAEITSMLEKSDISLKESMELYKEGVELSAECKKNLEGVEKEIQILNEV